MPASYGGARACDRDWCYCRRGDDRDGARFISAALLSLSTMVRLEMPHVNILSKVDLLPKIGDLRTWRSLAVALLQWCGLSPLRVIRVSTRCCSL